MAKQPKVLIGQVAAITGGARGIGRAMARAFIAQGMKVAIGDLDVEAARATAEELGAGTIAVELNVTDRASVERFADEVEAQLGPIDVYVNNAGIMQLSHFLDEDDATAHRMMDINVHGVLYGMKVVLPRMVARNRGHVVNVASQAGKFGFAGGATYCATKFAVVGVTESVRQELRLMGASGVALSVVMPAIVQTELGGGLDQPRGQKPIQPEDVAAATVEALQTERFDVWVPKENARIGAITGVLPRKGREAITRAMKADQVLWSIDHSARRGYELRAARSEPGLEPGSAPAELTAGARDDAA
ncbi:MAG TPA: SDR family oxidoreductase [Capillimicrobium sp.]|jgi:NADP-dependent 3-hydroxy acid dehydrogenase YdfG